MKKFTAILMAVLMLLAFVSCGKENNDNNATLEAFYAENYEGEKSGKLIRDFDSDGTDDMIAVTFEAYETGCCKDLSVHYVKINEGSAREVDLLSFELEDRPFIVREYMEIYASEDPYLMFNILTKYDGYEAEYRLLKITEDSIDVENHLFDPGYTSGVGLYFKEDYPENYDTKALYGLEIEQEYGKYDSYKAAIDAELGFYGFEWKRWPDADQNDVTQEKYIVDSANGAQLIFESDNEFEAEY